MNSINFDNLKRTDRDLYKLVTDRLGLALIGEHEFQPIQFAALTPALRRRLSDWKAQQPAQAPPAPALIVAPTPAATEPQISMAQIEAENNADIQRRIDKAHAIQRLEEYAKNAGLADTQANANLIREWVEASGGLWTVQIVDAAIQDLNQKLEWHDPAVPTTASAPEAEKPEVLQPWQLKIDTPDWQLKTASVEALKDLVARRRLIKTGKYIRPRGTFGSSIF
jgi:hypothetical protein